MLWGQEAKLAMNHLDTLNKLKDRERDVIQMLEALQRFLGYLYTFETLHSYTLNHNSYNIPIVEKHLHATSDVVLPYHNNEVFIYYDLIEWFLLLLLFIDLCNITNLSV